MIKTINDKEKLININPLVIYFVLSAKEYKEYREDILNLNDYVGFTRGIFKFEVLAKGDIDNSILPSSITSEFITSNIFLRLIDSADGAFNYLFSHIDLAADSSAVEDSFIDLAVRACNENIAILESLSKNIDSNNSTHSLTNKAIGIFNKAIAKRHFRRGVWRSPLEIYGTNTLFCLNKEIDFCDDAPRLLLPDIPSFASNHKISSKAQRALDLIKSEFDEDDMHDILMEILSTYGQVPDVESSSNIVEGIVNDKYSDNLRRDHYKRFEPKKRPHIKIHVKRVTTTTRSKASNKYGVEIAVDDKAVSIYFKSKDQTMLYIASLICRKIGRPLYLNELYDKSLFGPKQKRENLKPWLKDLYNTIYLYPSKTFEEWFDGINKQRGRPIHQGKSQVNTKIEMTLKDMSDAIYYCILNTHKDSRGKSYYWLNCSADEIELNSEIELLCEIPAAN